MTFGRRRRSATASALGAIALTVGLLTGCGGGGAGGDDAGLWSKQQAAAEYTKMATPVENYREAWKAKTLNMANVGLYCAGLVFTYDDFLREVEAGRWPTNIRPEIRRLQRAVLRQRTFCQGLRGNRKDEKGRLAATLLLIRSSEARAASRSVSVAANELLLRLGLPGTDS